MKYRYLISYDDNSIQGVNELIDGMEEQFQLGIIEIIDCEHGELMTNYDPAEWECIEGYMYGGIMRQYIIRLTKNNAACSYVAEWSGDPGRTYRKDSATVYYFKKDAENALKCIKDYYKDRSFDDAKVIEI